MRIHFPEIRVFNNLTLLLFLYSKARSTSFLYTIEAFCSLSELISNVLLETVLFSFDKNLFQILHGITYMWNLKKKVKLIEIDSRKVVTRGCGVGEIGRGWERVQKIKSEDIM